MVKVGEDGWEAREIVLAGNNDSFVMITDGVQENDVVAMNPRECLPFVSLPEIEETSPIGRDQSKTGSMAARGKPGGKASGKAGGKPGGKASGKPGGRPR